jgi:hypothetical protein
MMQSVMDPVFGLPYREDVMIEKYHNHRTPADGEPDEVVIQSQWYEADGTMVTDPVRIAALEAGIPRAEGSDA